MSTLLKIILPLLLILFSVGDFIGEKKVVKIEKIWLLSAINSVKRIISYMKLLFTSLLLQIEILISLLVSVVLPIIFLNYLIPFLPLSEQRSYIIMYYILAITGLLYFYIRGCTTFLLSLFIDNTQDEINIFSYFANMLKSLMVKLFYSKSSNSLFLSVFNDISISEKNDEKLSLKVEESFDLTSKGMPDNYISLMKTGWDWFRPIFRFMEWFVYFTYIYFLFYLFSIFFFLWSLIELVLYCFLYLFLAPSLLLNMISKITGQSSIIKIGKYIITILLFILSLLYYY